MCGRYTTGTEIENIRFREIIAEANQAMSDGQRLTARADGDVYPSDVAPAILRGESSPHAVGMRWGMRAGKSLVINARSESVLEKPMFKDSVRVRRCLLPAMGYYEWNARKEKFLFRLPDRDILYLAGLYRPGDAVHEFTILTREAYEEAREVHARMPLIIRDIKSWLFDDSAAFDMLKSGGEVKLEIVRQSPEQLSMF